MGRKNQMREFAGTHSGQTFTATGLARELKWKTGARSVVGVARKCGAKVEKVERKIPSHSKEVEDRVAAGYDISF